MSGYGTIRSTGAHIPPIEMTNEQLKRDLLEIHHGNPQIADALDKFEISTGIRKRFWAPDDQCTSDIALPAAVQALQRAGRAPADVDLILLGTDSPDAVSPATSTHLQHKLGAKNAGCFDVGCACASFPTVLQTAAGFIATNDEIKTVLCVGAYMMHKLTHPGDPMRFLFGDGAGAAVVERAVRPGFISGVVRADGSYWPRMGVFAGGTLEPATEEAVRAGRTYGQSPGRYPPELNLEFWPAVVHELARRGRFEVRDIDLLILTQIRKPTIEEVMKRLELPMDKTFTIMEEQGYTGSACIAMAFDAAVQAGRARPGSSELVVMVGSGVGWNLAGCAFRMA